MNVKVTKIKKNKKLMTKSLQLMIKSNEKKKKKNE